MRRGAGIAGRGDLPALFFLVIFISLFSAGILPGVCSAVPAGDNASAEDLTATFFYSEHCIACTKALPVADRLAAEYPSVTFVKYNVGNSTENESLFFSFGEAYGNPYPRYPTVFLSDGSFFEGYGAISADLPLHLASPTVVPAVTGDSVVAAVTATDPALDPVSSSSANLSVVPASFSLPPVGLVITAGLIDGINPCAVAVLIFLLLTLAGAGGRMQMLRFGAAYVAGIYLIYFIAGFGLLTAVRVTGLSWYFSCAAGVIALLLGVVMVADSFRQDGGGYLRISSSRLTVVRRIALRGGVISAFLVGVVVSLIELPCTGGVYLAILAMLAGSEVRAATGLLALYNLMFVLPLLVIITAAVAGFPPERMSVMRLDYRQLLRRAGGCTLILLGVAVLIWFSV
ncbi:hypothetical protein MKMG_01237 [Methanogenium sp. MK-MG]|nr:hypothetical protein MKMG_01237 [Methanogenium sp. MK-MG]